MSDRIVVMNAGRVEQVGDARDLYLRPASPFVASFIGEANQLRGTLISQDRLFATVAIPGAGQFVGHAVGHIDAAAETILRIRPEAVVIHAAGDDIAGAFTNTVAGTIQRLTYLGATTRYVVSLPGDQRLSVSAQNHAESDVELTEGARVILAWQPAGCQVLPG
jgi:ABC-type Fe3+/spermidine/putrescine transport system ATPase subunit